MHAGKAARRHIGQSTGAPQPLHVARYPEQHGVDIVENTPSTFLNQLGGKGGRSTDDVVDDRGELGGEFGGEGSGDAGDP